MQKLGCLRQVYKRDKGRNFRKVGYDSKAEIRESGGFRLPLMAEPSLWSKAQGEARPLSSWRIMLVTKVLLKGALIFIPGHVLWWLHTEDADDIMFQGILTSFFSPSLLTQHGYLVAEDKKTSKGRKNKKYILQWLSQGIWHIISKYRAAKLCRNTK